MNQRISSSILDMLFYLWLCSKSSESVCSLWFLRRICLRESFHIKQCCNLWLIHIFSHAKSSLFSRLFIKFFRSFLVNCFCQSYSLSTMICTWLSTLDHHVSKMLYIYLLWVLFATKEHLWSDFLFEWFVIFFHASFIFSLSHFFLKSDHELLLLSTWSLNIHASK